MLSAQVVQLATPSQVIIAYKIARQTGLNKDPPVHLITEEEKDFQYF